jgi:hypothetical protein
MRKRQLLRPITQIEQQLFRDTERKRSIGHAAMQKSDLDKYLWLTLNNL